jgi:hypothetical protein
MFAKVAEMAIPDAWIHSTLAGLEWVNPFLHMAGEFKYL